jgi:sigma-B regulation protein RsbU (phosphoserine phosphatase)
MANPLRAFWCRISEGIEIQRLWVQFRSEARASYQLYSKEVDWKRQQGESRRKRFLRVIRGLFWAMMTKLSPARRVLFLIALVFLFSPRLTFVFGEASFELQSLAFLGGLALFVLLALELADRVMMKSDLEIAREIQSWLMPAQPPQVRGVDIAFANRPANTVAGDYYDAFLRSPTGSERQPYTAQRSEHLLLVVADVAGKSVPAALLMATLQASLHTLAAIPSSLLDLVGRLNQYVCAQNLGRQRFTTGFLAEFEPATGHLAYVNAGHNWPVLRRKSGEIERLQTGGLPLGIMLDARYECGNTTVAMGDLLLIFTDGLIEAEDEKEQEYGETRMLGVIDKSLGKSAPEVLKELMVSVDAFVGAARQHDDITCLVLRTSSAD